jgi:nucleoside phosphorylase
MFRTSTFATQQSQGWTGGRHLTHASYNVGWVCALSLERTVAMALLDEQHHALPQSSHDDNSYTLGRMGSHNIVIACLPAGQTGNNSAATVASQMRSTFTAIEFGLMVGIGGGAPSRANDIRLGDVVVSQPGKSDGGVIQYDFGRTITEGSFIRSGTLNSPPQVLLNAMNALQAHNRLSHIGLERHLSTFRTNELQQFTYQGSQNDLLFDAGYDHATDAPDCHSCDPHQIVPRQERPSQEPVIHYGTIASGNQVMRHGGTRDRWSRESGVLCFEMEAAGLMNTFPCLVIRGICDYADSHKNKRWQEYAAAAAAAYAKELLSVTPSRTQRDVKVGALDYGDNLGLLEG